MGISGPPRATIARELLVANPSRKRLETVEVRMINDGHGITSHERRPREIRPKAGDVLLVSSDLADNWGDAGYCEVAEDPPTVMSASPLATEVVPTVQEVETTTPAPVEAVVGPGPALDVEIQKPITAPRKKRSLGRKKSGR